MITIVAAPELTVRFGIASLLFLLLPPKFSIRPILAIVVVVVLDPLAYQVRRRPIVPDKGGDLARILGGVRPVLVERNSSERSVFRPPRPRGSNSCRPGGTTRNVLLRRRYGTVPVFRQVLV